MTERAKNKKRNRRRAPAWVSFAIVISLTLMLCLTVNYHAFSDVRGEIRENELLSNKVQGLMDENIELQEEIHNFKTDPQAIGREAKRLGIPLKP